MAHGDMIMERLAYVQVASIFRIIPLPSLLLNSCKLNVTQN